MEDFKKEKCSRVVCREGQMPEMKSLRIEKAKKMIEEAQGFLLVTINPGSNKDGREGLMCESNANLKASMVPAVLEAMDKVTKQLIACAPTVAQAIVEDIIKDIQAGQG